MKSIAICSNIMSLKIVQPGIESITLHLLRAD